MKRARVTIPSTPLDHHLNELQALKQQAWKLLSELEQAAGADSAQLGKWRHHPIEWLAAAGERQTP